MTQPTAAPDPLLAEDFAHIAELLNKALDDENDRVFQALLANNFNIILAALRLAPAGVAAIAYHDAGREPLDLTLLRDAWEVLQRAIEVYREARE